MKNIKVMIVGCGGNGSWFMRHIHRLVKKDQIPMHVEFTLYDGDDIEKKNLLYQDFETKEVLDNKAKVLADRYDMVAKQKYVKDAKEFEPYDVIIAGVDNRDFREMLFKAMDKTPEKYWIDMRAEGRVAAIYAKHRHNTLAKLLDTIPKDGQNKTTSCQLAYELDAGIIQLGNQIVSIIGAQYLLNYLRGEENPPEFIHMF